MIVGVARNAPADRPERVGPTAYDRTVRADICREAKEAAHYMAALGRTPNEVTRIADRLIADRKYPALGDEGTAAIAMAVIQSQRAGMSPAQIVQEIEWSGVCTR